VNEFKVAMQESLSIVKLNKAFGGLAAVVDLDFHVPKGHMVGIIGPNGAGKTTVFNLITGFLRPDRGQVLWQGEDIVGKKPHQIARMGISRTFQLVKPFYELSLFDNIRVACYGPRFAHRNSGAHSVKEKVHEVALKIGLPSDLDQLASNLGQGDLRLLDIARALITEPDLLLLDEPFSGLSSIEARKLSGLIQEFKQQGLSILMIEHRVKELVRLVDRIVAINFGIKIAEGIPEEVVNDPAVVKAYLGTKRKDGIA
jgi:branched-chain amino acid transport system ATP-binding protein